MDGIDTVDQATHPAGCGPLESSNNAAQRSLRQAIFEHVRSRGQAARADIARALGVSPGSTTTVTAELIAQGLLREVAGPARDQGRGRPRVALEIVPQAGHVIGIRLGHERHTAVVSDFAGRVVADAQLAARVQAQAPDALLDQLETLLVQVLRAATLDRAAIDGVAIGLPGIIGNERGIVRWSPLLDRRDVALGAAFTDRFDLPVELENDANMRALSELWFGVGRSLSDFAVVTIENGVGMGLVLNGALYCGAHGMGLELGHTKVQIDGALCRCGQRGCLEAYLADYALAREATTALNYPVDKLHSTQATLGALFDAAQAGDEAALTIFKRAGRYLALGLSNVMQLFDPAVIILSGERMRYDLMSTEEIEADVDALTLSRGQQPCRVHVHHGGDLASARGATARALAAVTQQLFAPEDRAA